MCVASAYLRENQKEEILMKEIAFVEAQEDGLLLRSIFGEEKFIKARLKEIDFVASKILIEKVSP